MNSSSCWFPRAELRTSSSCLTSFVFIPKPFRCFFLWRDTFSWIPWNLVTFYLGVWNKRQTHLQQITNPAASPNHASGWRLQSIFCWPSFYFHLHLYRQTPPKFITCLSRCCLGITLHSKHYSQPTMTQSCSQRLGIAINSSCGSFWWNRGFEGKIQIYSSRSAICFCKTRTKLLIRGKQTSVSLSGIRC